MTTLSSRRRENSAAMLSDSAAPEEVLRGVQSDAPVSPLPLIIGTTLENSMKKTLLALAAVAASSAAFAQSSLTLYGVADLSVERVKDTKQYNRVSSSNYSSSRIGFKGTEDLGEGLKANFVLESGVNVDTGENGGKAVRFFDRAAWVGLTGGAGEVRVGRQDTSIGLIAADTSILGGQNYDDLKMIKSAAADGYRRADNAITYVLPQFITGLTSQLQYTVKAGTADATGGESSDDAKNVGRATGLNVKYANGPVLAGLGYINVKDTVPGNVVGVSAGDQHANATLVYAGYDLGMAKVIAYYDTETKGAERMSLIGLKAVVPVSEQLTVTAGLSQAKNTAGLTAGNDDAMIVSAKAAYKLSKRTVAYGMGTLVDNEAASKVGVTKVASGDQKTGGIAFGVSHAF